MSALRKLAIKEGITAEQLTELLGFINTIGGLQVHRSLGLTVRHLEAICKTYLHGVFFAPIARRYSASWDGIIGATARTCLPVVTAGYCTAGLVYSSGLCSGGAAFRFCTATLLLFLFSVFVHEQAHVWAIESTGRKVIVLCTGLRIGVVHRRLSPDQEITSALSGPFTAIAVCALALVFAGTLGQPMPQIVIGSIMAFHALSLLPWYGDGKSIQRALQTKRKEMYS